MLLESVLRNCDGYEVTEDDVRNLAGWNAGAPAPIESPLQAGPRRAAGLHRRAGRGRSGRHARAPCSGWAATRKQINPLIPVDLVIDHSVQVDYFGSADALRAERRPGVPAQPRALRVPALGPEGVRQLPRRAAGQSASSTR